MSRLQARLVRFGFTTLSENAYLFLHMVFSFFSLKNRQFFYVYEFILHFKLSLYIPY